MPYNQITCKTFCDRWFGCSYYKKANSYSKTIELIFKQSLTDYSKDQSKEFIQCFVDHYNSRTFSGKRAIYVDDEEEFDNECTLMAVRLSSFLRRNKAVLLKDPYLFRSRIKGDIGGIITNEGDSYTVDFSFATSKDTYTDIAYHKFNLFLYNMSHNLNQDCMVYVPMSDSSYIIKYRPSDYTIKRGFIQTIIKNRAYNPGYQCLTCSVKDCKPRLIVRRR